MWYKCINLSNDTKELCLIYGEKSGNVNDPFPLQWRYMSATTSQITGNLILFLADDKENIKAPHYCIAIPFLENNICRLSAQMGQ